MSACPQREELELVARGLESDAVCEHVESCSRCAGEVRRIRRDNAFLADFLAANADEFDEVGPQGDTLHVSVSGDVDVFLDGGGPAGLPGDRLFLSGPATYVNFEQVFGASLPATGWAGVAALVIGIVATTWLRLRRTLTRTSS